MSDIDSIKEDAKAIIEAIDAVAPIMKDFCDATGVSPTRLGYLSVGNPSMYHQLSRDKRRAQSDTLQRIMTWIVNWTPETTAQTGDPRGAARREQP